MTATLNQETRERLWFKRQNDIKQNVNTVSRIIRSALTKDLQSVIDAFKHNREVRTSGGDMVVIPVDTIANNSVLEMRKQVPAIQRANSRLVRRVISDFNLLSEYPDVEFGEYYSSIIRKRTTNNLTTMTNTTIKKTEALYRNQSVWINAEEITDEIKEVFDTNNEKYFKDNINRGDIFSWTTATQISGEVDNAIFSNSEFVEKKQWHTQNDDRVRFQHREENNNIVAVNDVFPVTRLPYPQQYRCRCFIVPVFKSSEQVIDEFIAQHGII